MLVPFIEKLESVGIGDNAEMVGGPSCGFEFTTELKPAIILMEWMGGEHCYYFYETRADGRFVYASEHWNVLEGLA